jgi:hypothetical protein
MPIPQSELKVLWGRAGSKCSLCRRRLDGATEERNVFHAGEAAHIIAQHQSGPRGESILGPEERNSYFNLILLCPTCHALVDKNPSEFPIEKLHMLKASHELRVQGLMVSQHPLPTSIDSEAYSDINAIVTFVRSWSEFLPFYSLLFTMIQAEQIARGDAGFFVQGLPKEIPKWHSYRDSLKEKLYHARENALIVQPVASWERLRKKSKYIGEGEYLTPFSFILDFVNPIHMVVNYGDELWEASFISHEFIDLLSYRYKQVKQAWRKDA